MPKETQQPQHNSLRTDRISDRRKQKEALEALWEGFVREAVEPKNNCRDHEQDRDIKQPEFP